MTLFLFHVWQWMTNSKIKEWIAVDDDTYDGAPDSKSLCGTGSTEQEAIDDLIEKMKEKGEL